MNKVLLVPFASGFLLLAALPTAYASDPKPEQGFGYRTVSGDFNGDGYDDLAVGNPSDTAVNTDGQRVEGGSVHLFYGSDSGLSEQLWEVWFQDAKVFPKGMIETGDQFGYALAAGDINGDGFDDLAIGAPGEDINIGDKTIRDAGVVNFLYGSQNGLVTDTAQTWYQSQQALPGISENDDGFGMALAIGDFDNDGYGDLAVGVPLEDVGNIKDMGVVVILRGSANGLTPEQVTEWHQNKYGVTSTGHDGEMFGFSLVSGDFNADNIDDLAIGVPHDMVTTWKLGPPKDEDKAKASETKPEETGAVNVLYGSSVDGLRTDNDQWWHQNIKNIEALAEKDDLFGWSLAAGDFNGDRVDDLAIGIPGESLKKERNVKRPGAVEILFGQAGSGLSADNDQFWHQASNIQSVIEDNDYFGAALASGDFDNDGIDDLAIGVPGEDVGNIHDAGLVNVLYGAYGKGLIDVGQVWHQNKIGVKGSARNRDQFGSALAAGDFDGSGSYDLAIGNPSDKEGSADGSVNVLYGGVPVGLSDALDELVFSNP